MTEQMNNLLSSETGKILVVEDELLVALDIRRILEKRGFTIVGIADTGESAIESAGQLQPDLVLMDITLRGQVDGIEAARSIIADYDIPVVYLTSHSDEDTLHKIRDSQVYGYLVKPVNASELFVTVALVINKHRFERRIHESERKYRDLVLGMQEGVWLIDSDGSTSFVNPRMAEMLGYEADEMIGRPIYGFLDEPGEHDARAHMENWRQGIREQRTYSFVRKDGGMLYASMVSSPLFNEGSFTGVLACIQDFSKQKKLEDSLRESEERYRRLVETSPNAIYLAGFDGTILFSNCQAAQLFGYADQAEFAGANLFELVVPEERGVARDIFKRVKNDSSIQVAELHMLRKDREQLLVDINSSLIRDGLGNPEAVIGVIRDITEARKIEQQLQRAQKLESIGILAGGIAHDFNNIMMVVAGNLSLAKMELDPESRVYEMVSSAESATMRASDLTQQLLIFSRGGNPVRKTASIGDLLRETVSFALRGSKTSFKLVIPDDIWPALVDEGQINQVFNNLVINADQAMPDGGTITVRAENIVVVKDDIVPLKPGRYIRISIEDQGVGIMKDHFQKIFDPYFTTKKKGSGLGLAIVYSIIKKHRGYIDLESRFGQGTTFFVYLPASDEPVEKHTGAENEAVSGKGRVLVMDDVEEIRRTVSMMLEHLGYSVECVSDGDEVIREYGAARSNGKPFDCVIMDLTVPGKMGGMEAMSHLKKLDPDVRAIVSSGYSNDPVLSDYRSYGFRGVIVKPFRIEDLGKTLKEVMAS